MRGQGTVNNRIHDRLGFVLLLLLLAWSLVPFGSNRPWAEALFSTFIFGLLSLMLMSRIWQSHLDISSLRLNRPEFWIFFTWILWVFFQTVPLPPQVIQWLSPNAYAIQLFAQSSDELMSISLDRDASLLSGLRISTAAALAILLLLFLDSRRRLLVFALALVVCGLLEALIGLGIYWSGMADTTVQIDSRDTIGPVGTFISRNHFAGFLEMALAMNTGLILIYYKSQSIGSGWRASVRDLSGELLSIRGFLLMGQLVIFAALILSGSRGGVLAFLIASIVVGASLAFHHGAAVLRAWIPIALTAIGAVFWFGGGAFLNRIGTLGLSNNRLDLVDVGIGIITDYPITGSGAGTFRWIFPLYKDARFGGLFYEHAHNDYLEIAIEQGLLGLLMFLSLTGLLLFRTYRAYCERHDRLARSVSLGAMIAGVSILSHSMIDFNLQIPANFYWFFAILTAGACAGQVERRGGAHSHEAV